MSIQYTVLGFEPTTSLKTKIQLPKISLKSRQIISFEGKKFLSTEPQRIYEIDKLPKKLFFDSVTRSLFLGLLTKM